MEQPVEYQATGKRKTATASVILRPGTGEFTVNGRKIEEYFTRDTLIPIITEPLQVTHTLGRYNIRATVKGGGATGQAGALRHGLAKALTKTDEKLRTQLKQLGLLTRDPRMKERKKYGLAGRRKRFQFSKR